MEQKIKSIVDYIYRKKGVVISVIPPRNERELALMEYLYSIAIQN